MAAKKNNTRPSKAKDATSETISNNKTTVDNNKSSDVPSDNKENMPSKSKTMPPKRRGVRIHDGGKTKRKTMEGKTNKISLHVEGYAFHDDIIGVTHLRPDGEDAYNLSLRNKIIDNTLEDRGFSSFCMLRDKSSGKDDDYLQGTDGYPKYIFMSIGIHKFATAKEASSAVLEQCKQLQEVNVT